MRVVKAFARQGYEQRQVRDAKTASATAWASACCRCTRIFWPITDMMTGLQMLAGYVIGAMMVIDGTITLGTYLAYVGMIIWIIEPMRGLGRIIVQASTGLGLLRARDRHHP